MYAFTFMDVTRSCTAFTHICILWCIVGTRAYNQPFLLCFSLQRWYATEEAARSFNLIDELEGILQSIRAEERLVEAKQQELAEQLKAQLAANNALLDTEEKKEQNPAAPSCALPDTAATPTPPPAGQQDKTDAGGAPSAASGNGKLHAFFAKRVEPVQQQQQQPQQARTANEPAGSENTESRPSGTVVQMLQQQRRPSASADSLPWSRELDTTTAAVAAGIAATSAAAAAAAAAGEANPQDAALAAHVAAAALLAAKLARGAAKLGDGGEAASTPGSEVEIVSVNGGNGMSQQATSAVAAPSPPAAGRTAAAGRRSALGWAKGVDLAPCESPGTGASLSVELVEDLDQVSSGKRMRKSAVPQDLPVDAPGNAATKRVKRRPSALAASTSQGNPS